MSTAAEILTPPPHGYQPGTARAALSYRGFRVIFFGLALSNIGTWMQNFTLPAYIDDRTGRPALVGLMVFMQLGPLLLLSIPGGVLADRVSKQKLQLTMQAVVGDLHPGDRRTASPRTPRSGRCSPTQLLIGIANALNAPAVPVVDAAARPPPGPAGSDQPQLGDDERHPGRRPGPRRPALRRRHVGLRRLHRQRVHLPVLHRRPALRAHARRQEHPRRQGLAPAGHRPAHRARAARAQPAAARDVPVLAVQPRLHRAVPVGRSPRVRHRIVEQHLPLALRGLGHGCLPRRDLGRHRPGPRRSSGADRSRLRRVRRSSSPSSPRPADRHWRFPSRPCSASPTS